MNSRSQPRIHAIMIFSVSLFLESGDRKDDFRTASLSGFSVFLSKRLISYLWLRLGLPGYVIEINILTSKDSI